MRGVSVTSAWTHLFPGLLLGRPAEVSHLG
jgi:hypothetical protein